MHIEILALRHQLACCKRGRGSHIIVFNESSLRRILKAYFEYYEHSRTHLALAKDAPESRTIQPPALGTVIELAQGCGRLAAETADFNDLGAG
jgi:hypothetical protein